MSVTPGPEVSTDADLERFLRARVGTSYHASGACRMGTDGAAVVDTDGRVRGIGALRVVDSSIMPRVVTANLNATTMMLAEKLSDRIRGRDPLTRSTVPVGPAG